MLKEIAVLECKMRTFSKLARSALARICIDFLNVSFFLSDTVVYSAIPYVKI